MNIQESKLYPTTLLFVSFVCFFKLRKTGFFLLFKLEKQKNKKTNIKIETWTMISLEKNSVSV